MANGFKTGGRQKGTQNKVSGSVKEMISLSIRKELENLPVLLKQLEPKDRMEIIIKLIPYIVPKANNNNDDPIEAKQNKSDFISNLLENMRKPLPKTSEDFS